MSEVRADLYYTSTHEWVKVDDGGNAIVGITDFAQDALGDVVFVELPNEGQTVSANDDVAAVESVKAASDIYAPVDGEVVSVNEALEDTPDLLNSEPFDDGWIFVLRPNDVNDLKSLLDSNNYEKFCESEDH